MIVIPMVGLSSRFFREGYTKPKYMLCLGGLTVFEHSLLSFRKYFSSHDFLFVIRKDYDTEDFVRAKVNKLGIKNFKIVVSEKNTRGQAETVAIGLKSLEYQGPITIFNIDTFRPNFTFPSNLHDGYLEVFKGTGDNWSYVKPYNDNPILVQETAEKKPISDLCCSGLYHFSSAAIFLKYYEKQTEKGEDTWQAGELYVAPIYNYLIEDGFNIGYDLIEREAVIFCGVPEEYEALKRKF